MKKHLIFILSFIAINTYAMKMEIETQTNYPKPCWFIGIPEDILNLIASYLTFDDVETEQEFIDRTKTMKHAGLKRYVGYLVSMQKIDPYKTTPRFYCVFCPNNKIIAMLEQDESDGDDLYCGPRISPELIIIDQRDNQKIYEENLSECCLKPAVSRNGTMFAFIHRGEEVAYNNDTLDVLTLGYKNILSIKNIASRQRESHVIPDSFLIAGDPYSAIAFNKQGTHIIIHGIDFQNLSPIKAIGISQNPIRNHKIIPLTVNTSNPEADNKKTLAKHFAQQMVCKDFTKQLL